MTIELSTEEKRKCWEEMNSILSLRIKEMEKDQVDYQEKIARLRFELTHPLFSDDAMKKHELELSERWLDNLGKDLDELKERLTLANCPQLFVNPPCCRKKDIE
jgi:hypothetical protein